MPDRRNILAIALLSPLIAAQAAKAQSSCSGTLSLSDRNRRRALGFVEISKSEDKRCAHCTFFTATDRNCGACQMLSGQSVSGHAVCNSFVAK